MPLSKPINNFVSAIRDAFTGDCCKHRRSDNKNQMASGRKITVLSRDNITSPPGKKKYQMVYHAVQQPRHIY